MKDSYIGTISIDVNKVLASTFLEVCKIGGTQTLFRNLPKVSNFGKTLGPSCSGSKIVPTHKFWVHDHILESSNRIQRLEIIDWDKYPLK